VLTFSPESIENYRIKETLIIMPDANGRPYLREIRKKAEQLGIITHTNARQRKADLEAEVAAHPVTQYYSLKEALCEEVVQNG
jgi:SNF2 family DNA or RNA helicase